MTFGLLHQVMILSFSALALSACKGSSKNDSGSNLPNDPVPPVVTVGDMAEALSTWYVTEYDTAAVRRIRESTRFMWQKLATRIVVSGHPKLDGTAITTHAPYEAVGLEYARSVGLDGSDVVVAMIDSPILLSHEKFSGQDITAPNRKMKTGESHGTAVASIIVGSDSIGEGVGMAPGVGLVFGSIDYNSPLNWSLMADHMYYAGEHGAIASNNSWSINSTVADGAAGAILESQPGQAYLAAVREFTQKGVVVFSLDNDYASTSATFLAGLPAVYPHLEHNWLAVINGIPVLKDGDVISATRVSSACLEAARWCLAADGQVRVADSIADDAYRLGSGTSFAAPQVTSSLALLSQAFPSLSAAQLRARLLATADNGFFQPDGVVEFAPGISHGYSEEWGHGFVDLKAALLPIGKVTTPTLKNKNVPLDSVVLRTSPASGDALARALESRDILVTDEMSGSFAVNAQNIVWSGKDDQTDEEMQHFLRSDGSAYRRSLSSTLKSHAMDRFIRAPMMSSNEPMPIKDTTKIALAEAEGLRLSAIVPEALQSDRGLAVSQTFPVASSAFSFGVEAMHEDESVVGISGMTGNSGTYHAALTLGFATPLATATALRVDVQFGVATGGEAGALTKISGTTYDTLSIALARADAFTSKDVLTLFARRPVAITPGDAIMTLAVAHSAEGIEFDELSLRLAPTARQVDLGVEYALPLGKANLAVTARYSFNHGNIQSNSDFAVMASLS